MNVWYFDPYDGAKALLDQTVIKMTGADSEDGAFIGLSTF